MITSDYKHVQCDHEGCENKIRNHRWGHIKAQGWLFQKNGKVWCPDHLPDWVEEWRKKIRPE